MLAEFSAVAKLFSDAIASVKGIRGAVENTKGLLSDLDIEKTRKNLRTIYFFQDGITADLKRIAQSKGKNVDAFVSIIKKLDASENEIYLATKYFSSRDLETNLGIDIETVEKIQKIARLKLGIRAVLRKYVATLKNGKFSPKRLAELKKIDEDINTLRKDIKKIETALAKLRRDES